MSIAPLSAGSLTGVGVGWAADAKVQTAAEAASSAKRVLRAVMV
jgi:hypothetical protein